MWEYWGQTESLGARYAWAAGRLTNVSWQAGGSNMSASYAYKPGSDLLAETAFNSAAGLALKRAYDAANRLVSIQATNALGAVNFFSYQLGGPLGSCLYFDTIVIGGKEDIC